MLAAMAFTVPVVFAQPTVPPQAVDQFEHTIGKRVEAMTILGGDYGAASGIYTFRGGNLADLSVSKVGGGGAIAASRPLGFGDVQWAPLGQLNVHQRHLRTHRK